MDAATRGYLNADLYILGSTIGFLNKFKKTYGLKLSNVLFKTFGRARKKIEHDLRHVYER